LFDRSKRNGWLLRSVMRQQQSVAGSGRQLIIEGGYAAESIDYRAAGIDAYNASRPTSKNA
jgi:hypothetical protein